MKNGKVLSCISLAFFSFEAAINFIALDVGNEDVAGRVYSILKMYGVEYISIYIAPDVLTTEWSNMIKKGCSPNEIRCEWSEEV